MPIANQICTYTQPREKKSEIIYSNPQVCLQVEQVNDSSNWRSVIIIGEAQQLLDNEERRKRSNGSWL
jgi:nitroimidazol reductase NimA-like FMN-containing flavoprotein (pyridoxamine 5'-phosphate oxidase superfamily)